MRSSSQDSLSPSSRCVLPESTSLCSLPELSAFYDSVMFQLSNIVMRGHSRPRLDQVTLTIFSGRTAVVGYSGAGKTSLLNLLMGFEHPDSGSIRHESAPESAAGSADRGSDLRLPLFWVPQSGGLWPHLTVDQHLTCLGTPESSDKLLRGLDLEHRRTALPAELSLGERSRLALARALVANAEVLVLDEPLSHVDPVRKPAYWSLVREILQEDNVSMVFTSHDPEIVLRHSDRVICLDEGRVVFAGTTSTLYESPPTRETGEFLGPLNWFAPEETSLFLSGRTTPVGSLAIRPEHLILRADEASPVELISTPFQSGYAESLVKHVASGRTRTVLHQVPNDAPRSGQRVRLTAGETR